jgi:predicted DNA-binding protein
MNTRANTKQRLNITLSKEAESIVKILAKRDNIPQATKAAMLLDRVLEIEEDTLWSEQALERLSEKSKRISHKDAWL